MLGSVVKMIRSALLALCMCLCLGTELPAESSTWNLQCSLDEILEKLATDKNIQLTNGVTLVKVNETTESLSGRSASSLLTRVKMFFSNYELQLKFSDFFERKQDVLKALRRAFVSLNELQGGEETSRGHGGGGGGGGHGHKKGGNPILLMAAMMGGTMAALGFGALSMLVMKALTVSSMAFLLSAVIGLRRLLRRPDDDAGFGRISYIPVHAEHRKRRSLLDLPYRAYVQQR